MKCIDCEFYNPPTTINKVKIQAGCVNDGDITNPTEDINCVEGGDEELDG